MKKFRGNIITVIMVLIILALANHIIYTEYYKPKEVSKKDIEKKEIKNNNEKKDNIYVNKVDSSKEYIYDGEYVGDFSNDSYTTDAGKTYYSKDLKAPYFNIDSTDANNVNKEVNETYLNAVRIFNQGINDKSTYILFNYKKYENDNIISSIVKYEVGDVGVSNPIYYTYNFDKENGSLISFNKALSISGIKEDEIDSKIRDAIKKEIKNQMDDNKNAYPDGESIDTYIDKTYSGYEDNKKYNLIKYILNSKNKLSVVVDIRLPAELEHLNRVLDIN